MSQYTLLQEIKLLYKHLSKKRRLQLIALLMLMVCSSVAETLSIGAALPFLHVLLKPESLNDIKIFSYLLSYFNQDNSDKLLYIISFIFCILIIISLAIRLTLINVSFNLSFSIASDLSRKIFKNLIEKPYEEFIKDNSSEVISGLSGKINDLINNIINPILVLASSVILISFITLTLLMINYSLTIIILGLFGLIYYSITKINRNKLQNNSEIISRNSTKLINYIQEVYGNIRNIIIGRSFNYYIELYNKTDYTFRKSQANTMIISLFPRYIVETIGMILIISLSIYMIESGAKIEFILPTLGVFILAAQKLLPLIQSIYFSWANINGSKRSLSDCLRLLSNNNKKINQSVSTINFNKTIELKNISYSYDSNIILKEINIVIDKNDKIGIIGASGSGKSTLIDIISGLLSPESGQLLVDGIQINKTNTSSWQKNISYIPQYIFITDGSIIDNITLYNTVYNDKLLNVINISQLVDVINEKDFGLLTEVGENGVKLSGGQRQRIGIARALYNGSNVIILDEATSALDKNTENLLINSIYNLKDTTVIIVSHNESILNKCNKIYKIENKLALKVK